MFCLIYLLFVSTCLSSKVIDLAQCCRNLLFLIARLCELVFINNSLNPSIVCSIQEGYCANINVDEGLGLSETLKNRDSARIPMINYAISLEAWAYLYQDQYCAKDWYLIAGCTSLKEGKIGTYLGSSRSEVIPVREAECLLASHNWFRALEAVPPQDHEDPQWSREE